MTWWDHFAIEPGTAIGFIVVGAILDFSSLIAEMARNRRGHGCSGQPVIALLGYFVSVLLCGEPLVDIGPGWLSRTVLALALTIYHLACHWWIPLWHARWVRGKGGDAGG